MCLSTIIFLALLLGALAGMKKPWAGGVAGLTISPILFYFHISTVFSSLIIVTLACVLLGLASGFAFSIIIAGLNGKGHKAGTTYISGFGVHHPGGFILSNGERKVLKDKHLNREILISY